MMVSKASTTPTKSKSTARRATEQVSPRKLPRCVHCGRPKQGHQRSGCPFVDPPVPGSKPQAVEDAEIIGTLKSLHISNADEKEKRRRRSSARYTPPPILSVASLSTTSSEIVRQLGKPGAMAPLPDHERQDDVAPVTPKKSGARAQSKPLVRTATEIGRAQCLKTLEAKSKAPPANAYPLAVSEIGDMQKYAEGSGFRTRVLMPGKGAPETDLAFLVVGRDELAVDDLFGRVRDETVKRGSNAGTLLTGALAGAIATLAGLAYSP